MESFDLIIIGSGIAGLTVALRASGDKRIALLTKEKKPEGSTRYAQGGIASVLDPEDDIKFHIEDTLSAGDGLCREDRVEILASEGPNTIEQLLEWGVQFTPDESDQSPNAFHLALEGGHSRRRILHSRDLTGEEIMRALLKESEKRTNIRVFEHHSALDLLVKPVSGKSVCYGVKALDLTQKRVVHFFAPNVFLATGGSGQVYLHTTNPVVSTGDGNALAYRAGAFLEDMEFMQFHPTSLYLPGEKTFLISEALRGHGAVLKNFHKQEFMNGVHPLACLAPRDIVARAIHREMETQDSPHVYLDITHRSEEDLRTHFPGIYHKCLHYGINIAKDLIPVVPAAHYMCGGVKVDENCCTGITGLYACGETACTGVHGSNRLASNSLLESVVFSLRAYDHCVNNPNRHYETLRREAQVQTKDITVITSSRFGTVKKELQELMWHYDSIVRTNQGLEYALGQIEKIRAATEQSLGSDSWDLNLLDLRNMTINSRIMVEAALYRQESRGLHYNQDYPEKKDIWKIHIAFSRKGISLQ